MKPVKSARKSLSRAGASRSLVARVLETPDLAERVRELPPASFAALVRKVGLEDAGEIVALATTEQLVTAFDEDLFVNEEAGEREVFDARRFALWVEVLMEAGDEVAAARAAELSEDFLAKGITSLVMVLDREALDDRLSEGDDDAVYADKALESALTEELDNHILVSRQADGWDAILGLILALDRNHHALLVRILDRAADASAEYIDDLEALTTALNAADSLANDVEAEREDRRAAKGFVEPRAAKAFLTLAKDKKQFTGGLDSPERDPLTRAYFRELVRPTADEARAQHRSSARSESWLDELRATASPRPLPANTQLGNSVRLFGEALASLPAQVLDERMEELAYLANVLVAGAKLDGAGGRFTPARAAEAALATTTLGAMLALKAEPATTLATILSAGHADLLFRRASQWLAEQNQEGGAGQRAFLLSRDEVDVLLTERKAPARKRREP
ncbi:MAG: DUF6178 family protein [Polyangiaceae bacterium]